MSTATDPSSHLDVSIQRETAVIMFRRPERLNALDIPTRIDLAERIRAYGTGDEVRGIVLTGEGRAFSAGEDLQDAVTPARREDALAAVEFFHDITRAILATSVPVIAAVNGLAVGGASEVTLCCDGRIGTPNAEFFLPENKIGLTISNASSLLLRRLTGNNATRLVLGSPRIKAEEAHQIGLLDEIVSPDRLIDRSVDLIHEWTPMGGATSIHLALLRPTAAEIDQAITRENIAVDTAWGSGILRAAVERFQAERGVR